MRALPAVALFPLFSAMILGVTAPAARAQTCHPAAFRAQRDGAFHVGAVHVFATFSDDDERGEYQGLIPTFSWSHAWVTTELAVPTYRLQRSGNEAIGLGDVTASARVAVFRSDSSALAFGPELAVSFPTGDADRDLGMGHAMAMPGAWLRLEVEAVSVLAQLAYGRALASGEHPHHHGDSGAAPRVNPMNASEFEHALGVRYTVHPNLSVTARWLGAVPIDDDGVERQLIGPGLQLESEALDAALELQVPVAGDPFDLRFSVAIGAQL